MVDHEQPFFTMGRRTIHGIFDKIGYYRQGQLDYEHSYLVLVSHFVSVLFFYQKGLKCKES